jgi:DNA-binding transcriptional LysR family regulator
VDLRWLEIFCHVYRARSFSGAAKQLGLTQPTISDHVRSLETELGVRLLDRSAKQVQPTAAGKLLYRYGEQILALKDSAGHALQALLHKLEGELRVGASTIPGEFLLPELIASFRRRHPNARFLLTIADSQETIESVLAGRVELGFVGARQPQRGLEFHAFADDTLVLIGPPSNPAHLPSRVRFPQLCERAPLVIRGPGSGTRRALEAHIGERGISLDDFTIALETGSTSGVKQAVQAGLGYAFVSNRAIREELRHGLLRRFEVAELRGFRRTFYAVLPLRRSRSPLAGAFLSHALPE